MHPKGCIEGVWQKRLAAQLVAELLLRCTLLHKTVHIVVDVQVVVDVLLRCSLPREFGLKAVQFQFPIPVEVLLRIHVVVVLLVRL